MRQTLRDRLLLPTLMVSLFMASRLIFAKVGVHFDATTIDTYWQFLDRKWLEEDLLRSVYYLHSQPPAFNLFLGSVLKAAPYGTAGLVFHAIFVLISLAGYLLSFGLIRRMGAGTPFAAIVATLMVLTPTSILFENWLFYDLPVSVLLVGAAYALVRHEMARGHDRFWLVAFCGMLLALSLTRSIFHFIWIALLGLTFAMMGPRGRRLGLAVAITAILAALPSVKNKIVFGRFSSSTWLGMNAANVVQEWWLLGDRERLATTGAISRVSLIPPFSPLSWYPGPFSIPSAFEHVPALSAPVKSSGAPNYNHVAYIALGDTYARDALVLLRLDPRTALRGVGNGIDRFVQPGSVQAHVIENRQAIRLYDRLWNRIAFGLVEFGPRQREYLLLIVGTVIGIAFGGWLTTTAPDRTRSFTARFMMITIIFVMLVGNVFERGENHRFRVYLSPYIVTFLCLLGRRIVARLTRTTPAPLSFDLNETDVD